MLRWGKVGEVKRSAWEGGRAAVFKCVIRIVLFTKVTFEQRLGRREDEPYSYLSAGREFLFRETASVEA